MVQWINALVKPDSLFVSQDQYGGMRDFFDCPLSSLLLYFGVRAPTCMHTEVLVIKRVC